MPTLPDFVKLYGRLESQTLKAQTDYSLTVQMNFDAASIGARKFLVLETMGRFGGSDKFLAWVFLGTAAAIWLLQFLMLLKWLAHCDPVEAILLSKEDPEYIKSLKS